MTNLAAPDAPQSELINNRYRVLRELGRGGMGCVYLVEDLGFKTRPTALKKILPDAASSEFLKRFRIEFLNLSKLTHPSLTAAYDFGQIKGTREHFFTTAFVEGVDLLEGTRDATVDQLVDIITQTLSGMEFLHSHGLLHNDLKPANILLERLPETTSATGPEDLTRLEAVVSGRTGSVKIIDFGLLSAEHAVSDQVLGTPRYIAPERIRRLAADRRSDLYSLGMLFYVLCAREHPFGEASGRELLRMQLDTEPASLGERCPELPGVLVELVARLLRKDPHDRFDTAALALEFLHQGLGLAQSAPTRSRSSDLDPGSLMFRDEQLQLLVERFRETAGSDSTSPCVLIQGASGSGKTRLVADLRRIVQVEGGAFIDVSGNAVRGHLLPVMERIRHGLETCGSSNLDSLQRLGETGGDIASSLERALLEQATRIPVVIHFDDLQDASGSVRRFVLELLHTLGEVSTRTNDRPRLMLILSRQTGGTDLGLKTADLTTIALEPFSREQSRLFLERVFGQEGIPEEPLAMIVNAASGNPGLLLELARYLVEKNHVVRSGSHWIFPDTLAGVLLPENLGSVLEQRMESLDKLASEILEVICVAAVPVSAQVLACCLAKSEKRVSHVLERLQARGIIAVQSLDPVSPGSRPGESLQQPMRVYRVAHDGMRSTVAAKLAPEDTRSLHQSLARAFEAAVAGSPYQGERLGEILAHHWLAAGNQPAFLKYAPEAAQTLQRCGDLERAIEYHRQIFESLPADATASKVQSLVRLAEMHELLWDQGQSRANLQAILDFETNLLKPEDRAMTLRRIAAIEIARNDNKAALVNLNSARQALARPAEGLPGLALDAPEAWASWFCGDRERSQAALARAERVLETIAPGDLRQKALSASSAHFLASLHHSLGRLSKAEDTYRRIFVLTSDPKLLQAKGATHASYGGLLLDAGKPQAALMHLEAALKIAKQLGDRRSLCRTRERMGEYHLLHGDLKSAFQVVELGLEAATAVRHAAASASCLKTLGRIYLRAGLIDESSRTLEQALDLHRSAGDIIGVTFTRLYLARLRIVQARLDEALEEAETAGLDAARFDLAMAKGMALLLAVEARFLQSREVNLPALQEAKTLFQSSGFPGLFCEARLLEARMVIAAGQPELGLQKLSEIEVVLEASGSQEQRVLANNLREPGGAAGGTDDGVDPAPTIEVHVTQELTNFLPTEEIQVLDDCAK